YAISVTTLPVAGARGRRFPDRGSAGPGQPIPRRAGPRTGGQPTAVRERSTTECGRADASRTRRGVEQSADEQLRHLHYTAGIPLRWDDLPPSAASHHRRRTATGSQLPPHMVPHAKRGMEDQGLTFRSTRLTRFGVPTPARQEGHQACPSWNLVIRLHRQAVSKSRASLRCDPAWTGPRLAVYECSHNTI